MLRRRKKIDDSDRTIHDSERSRERTMNRAIRLLAAKPRSTRELRERLLEKPWTNAAIVDAVIEKLKGYEYLDDEKYARDLAIEKLRQKPQGRRRLVQVLSQKALDKETIESSVRAAYEKLPEEQLIEKAIEKRVASTGEARTHKEREKLYAYLARRGFSHDLINATLRRRVASPAKTDD